MFLRGTGTAASGKAGPALKAVQQDGLESHNHTVNINTNTTGAHDHTGSGGYNRVLKMDGTSTANSTDHSSNEPNLYSSNPIASDGNHHHNVKGNTDRKSTRLNSSH